MFTSSTIDTEGRTLKELLEFLSDFGPRYRLWRGRGGKIAFTPQEVLSSFDALDPVLRHTSEVGPIETTLGKRTLYGWRIFYYPQRTKRSSRSQQPSPYFIEDLLVDWRVREWLEQQEPSRIVAVLPRDARLSTFLQTYYLETLGSVPKDLEKARLPLWYIYLEGLISGLNPHQRLPYVEVNAETLGVWLGSLAVMWSDAQGEPGLDLNDGELEWECEAQEPFAQVNAQLERDPVTLPYSRSEVRAGKGLFTLLCHKGTLTILYNGDLDLEGVVLHLLNEKKTCVAEGQYTKGKALLTAPTELGGYTLHIIQGIS